MSFFADLDLEVLAEDEEEGEGSEFDKTEAALLWQCSETSLEAKLSDEEEEDFESTLSDGKEEGEERDEEEEFEKKECFCSFWSCSSSPEEAKKKDKRKRQSKNT
jgi:hypothetical protein